MNTKFYLRSIGVALIGFFAFGLLLFAVSLLSTGRAQAASNLAPISIQGSGTWVTTTSPTSTQLLDIDFVSPSNGWAVGGNYGSGSVGIVLHWDGNSWRNVSIPAVQVLRSVDMVSANDGWAVGGYDFGVSNLLRWNGTSWITYTSPTPYWMSGVSVVTANDIWAVGGGGKIIHWDGVAWNVITSPVSANMNAIEMVSASDGWAVGNSGTILRWNGSSWQTISSPFSGFLESVTMLNSNEGWIVGGLPNSTSLQWDGNLWTSVNNPTANLLYSVATISSTHAYAVGSGGVILNWNGNAWSSVSSPTNQVLNSVRMLSESIGWAMGTNGTILYYGVPNSATLSINYSNGKPGSFFVILGSNFPAGGTATISVNGQMLTNTVTVNSLGGFALQLDTSQADNGYYSVVATVNPSASTSFNVDSAFPLRSQEESAPILSVPSGIAFTKFLYLPIVQR